MSVFRFQAQGTSTPRRSRGSKSPPSFAFSTSPSILQDITMDKTSPCPSPSGSESPAMCGSDEPLTLNSRDDSSNSSWEMDSPGATGLTMKEYDETLKKLTAENFQLKLKIYFLNERIGKMDGIQDKELIQENIRLKVDNEQQSQEIERQSKLLIQALEAFEQIQRDHQQEMDQLTKRHEAGASEAGASVLENCPEIDDIESAANNEQIRDFQKNLHDSLSKVKELETVNNELMTKLAQLEEDAKFAQTYSQEKTSLLNQIKTYQEKLLQLQNQATALETGSEIPRKHDELEAELSARTAELAEIQTTYNRACDTIRSLVRRVLEERNENKRLEEALAKERLAFQSLEVRPRFDNATFAEKGTDRNCQCGVNEALARIKELENEVQVLKSKPEMGPGGDLENQLMEKECEIERIKNDLKKRTHLLQELVNKELWDKNRQIEKLEKKLMGVDDVERLKKDIKILSAEKRALSEELGQIKKNETTVKEGCLMLTKRLEELAGFLDSLITDRSLIAMNGETCKAIRKAIDSSRELSRRLTLSLAETTLLSRSEQISVIYCDDDDGDCRRESEPFIVTARESEKNWLELEMPDGSDEEDKPPSPTGIRRKVEKFCARALGNTIKGEMDASESEAWSEPDRSVSLARMGHIDSASVTPLRLSKSKNSSDSSEETLNETGPRSSGKRNRTMDSEMRKMHNKVKSLEEMNKELKDKLTLLENKHVILSKLHDHTSPQLLMEIQDSLTELDETRELCQRLKSDLATARGDLAVARQDLDAMQNLCAEQANALAKMETKADDVVLDYELQIIELTKEKDAAVKRALAMEETLAAAEEMRVDLERQVVEINKKLSEAQTWQDKSKAQVKEAGRHLDSCEKLLLEKAEYEKKMRELQLFVECLQKTVEEKQNEVDSWTARAQREHNEVTELKRRLLETERSKSLVETKIKEQGESMKWLEEKIREVEQATDQCTRETEAKIVEEVQKRVEAQMKESKKEWVPRVDLERAHKNLEVLEKRLSTNEEAFKERADYLMKKLNRLETEKRDWGRQMNDLRLRSSEMEVELTRLANEKVRLEEDLKRAVDKNLEVTRMHEKAEANARNLQKQVEYESSASGYTPASVSFYDFLSSRNLNSSPDLGIESDQGRFSSLELQEQRTTRVHGNMNRLEAENEELRQRMEKLGRDLEETTAELAAANYQKKQMERAICKQLHKTHHMLKKARRNLGHDSDSVDDRE